MNEFVYDCLDLGKIGGQDIWQNLVYNSSNKRIFGWNVMFCNQNLQKIVRYENEFGHTPNGLFMLWNITLFQSVWILSNNSLYRLRSAWEHPLAFVSRVVLYYYVTMVVKRSWIRTWNTFTPFPTHILTVKDGFPFCCFLRNKNRATALSCKK